MRPAPPEYKTHIYPMAKWSALKFDPDLDCSPARQPQQNAQARVARVTEGEREMQLAVVQIKAAREAAQEMWTVCASNEHDFSTCTKCRLCKNDGHWAQDCPEARKAD